MQIKKHIFSFLMAIVTIITLVPVVPAMATEVDSVSDTENPIPYVNAARGGWDQVITTAEVYDTYGNHHGTVYPGEGVTVIEYDSDFARITYSAGSSYKIGTIFTNQLRYGGRYDGSAVGLANANTTTYYAPYYNLPAGSVNNGEFVAVLSRYAGWDYIEYNIAGGMRKRAYVPSSCIDLIDSQYIRTHYHLGVGTPITVSGQVRVYAGPNPSTYPDIGYVSPADNGFIYAYNIFYDANGRQMRYIQYPASGTTKYGYIYC